MNDSGTPQTSFLISIAKNLLKGNFKIIINQINLGKWACNFFPTFQAHGNGRLQCIKQ
jgi:hypothetical protein